MANCRIVDEMLGIVDNVLGRYELLLCDACKDDQHADCGKKKSKLHISGYEILGECMCEHESHNSLRKKGNSDGENSGS